MNPTWFRGYAHDMTRTLGLALVLCTMVGGSAFAGRGHGGGGRHNGGNGGVIVRDHRGGGGTVVRSRGTRVRVSNGRYVFPGGVVRVYRRPVIRERYRDVHVRPTLIVESYDPVPGYIWMTGGWTWGGGEWVWTPGYWAVADEGPVVSGGISVSAGVSIH